MDYKQLVQQFNKVDSDISAFINERTNRNIVRGEEIVTSYVDALRNNEYSIKSFKAKIIHNELEHRRTTEEFNKLIASAYVKIDDILDKCFQNYVDVLSKSKFNANKTIDMREYEIAKRRNRQDILNKINSLGKEYHQGTIDDEELFNKKYEEYKETLNIEYRKLKIDLNKCYENTLKKSSNDEAALLVNDDKDTITKLKEAIKQVRILGLKEENELNLKSYLDIKNKKLDYINYKKEYLFDQNKKRYDMKVKTAEYQLQIKELEIQIERRGFDYDIEYKKGRFEKLRSDKYALVSLSRIHNDFLYKNEKKVLEDEKNFKFLIAFILIKFYQILITLCESSIFDPLIGMIEEFININKQNNENYSNTIKDIKKRLEESIVVLNQGLSEVSFNHKSRVSKQELQENVITSIERYYNNIAFEVAMFNDQLERVFLHIISKFNERYKNTVGKELLSYNDCLFLNTNYDKCDFSDLGYQKYDFNAEGAINLEDYYASLNAKIGQYSDTIEVAYENEMRVINKAVGNFEAKIKVKVDEVKDNFNKIIDDNKAKLEKENAKVENEIAKEIKKCEKEYFSLCNKEKKLHKKKMSVL